MAFTPLERKLLIGSYKSQRDQAVKRGIKFLLSYDEWLDVWDRSGKMLLRGAKAGCYCMGRKGDVGPYAVDNVYIIPVEQNHSNANKGRSFPKSAETRRKLSEAAKGRPGPVFSKETRAKLSAANKGKPKSGKAKAAMRKAALGREVSLETCIKLSRQRLGKHKTPETKKNMSAGQFKRWARYHRLENRVRL
jgi:hypothetical protein